MSGTIHLGGGGATSDEEPLWRAMLQGKRRVLYWPFALPPARIRDAEAWLTGAFAGLGAEVVLETWSDLSRRHPDEMAGADLLFVGGGSAGAILACSDIGVAVGLDENEVGLTDLNGLALVRDVAVLPHYDDTQAVAARDWSCRQARPLVGVPERSGLAVRDRDAVVVGHASVAVFDGGDVTVRRPGERWRTS